MKRIILTISILSLVLVLAACANKAEVPPADGNVTDNPKNPVNDVVDGVQNATMSLNDSATRMLEGMGEEAKIYSDVSPDMYLGTYGIDKGKYGDVIVKGAPLETNANEIIIIKARDEANLKEAVADLEKRKAEIQGKWKDTTAPQYKAASNAIVKTKGNYAVLIVADSYAEAEKVFDSLEF